MNNFMKKEVARNNKTKDVSKRGLEQFNTNRKMVSVYDNEDASTGHLPQEMITAFNDTPYVFTNNFTNIEQPGFNKEGVHPLTPSPTAPFGTYRTPGQLIFNKSNNLTDNGNYQSLNWGTILSKRNMIYDTDENNFMYSSKINEETLSPSIFGGKRAIKNCTSDDELIINPKSVFYSEETPINNLSIVESHPPTKKKYRKRSRELESSRRIHYYDPRNANISRPRVNLADVRSRSTQPMYGPREHIPRPLTPLYPSPYHHGVIHSATLFRPQERKNIKINQDPFFFRVPQPTNNSLIMNNMFIKLSPNTTNYPPIFKSVFRLKVDIHSLYDYDYIKIQEEEIPTDVNISDGLFASHLNKFNKKYGIPQLSVKYAVVMSFLYYEIRKQKGYWNVKPGKWRNLSTMIKDFVKIKEIYLFLVYPFEQLLLGHTKIVRYKDEEILQKYTSEFLIYSAYDINFYLKRGSLEELDMMLYQIDIKKMKIEGFILITTFLCDIFNMYKETPIQLENMNQLKKDTENHKNLINQYKRNYKEYQKKFNIQDTEYHKKIMTFTSQASIEYIRKCVDIAIQFGKFTQMCYKILDMNQQFLNRIFFCVMKCREIGILTWGEFYEYTNNCFKNFYFGTDEIYFNLYKTTKTNPLLVIRTFSNIRFSKVKTKRMQRRLDAFIQESIEGALGLLEMRAPVNDDKVLEYVISSFYSSKGFRKKIKHIVIIILKYYVYLYNNKIYQKSKKGSDLFKIITRLMLFEDVSYEVYANRELIEEVKKIPGLGELV